MVAQKSAVKKSEKKVKNRILKMKTDISKMKVSPKIEAKLKNWVKRARKKLSEEQINRPNLREIITRRKKSKSKRPNLREIINRRKKIKADLQKIKNKTNREISDSKEDLSDLKNQKSNKSIKSKSNKIVETINKQEQAREKEFKDLKRKIRAEEALLDEIDKYKRRIEAANTTPADKKYYQHIIKQLEKQKRKLDNLEEEVLEEEEKSQTWASWVGAGVKHFLITGGR